MTKGLAQQVTFCLLVFFLSIIYTAWKRSNCQGGWHRYQIFYPSRIFIEKAEGPASPTWCPCAAMLAPICTTPSAVAASSAEGSFTCANQSMAVIFAYLPSSVVPGLALLLFPATLQGHVFVPPSSTIPESAYIRGSAQTFFQGEIMPGNAVAHLYFSLGHST